MPLRCCDTCIIASSLRSRRHDRRDVQVAGTQPVDLKSQLVVLLRLPDPLHTDPSGGGRAAGISGADDSEEFVQAGFEGVVRDRVAGLGAQSFAPPAWVELPADLQIDTVDPDFTRRQPDACFEGGFTFAFGRRPVRRMSEVETVGDLSTELVFCRGFFRRGLTLTPCEGISMATC